MPELVKIPTASAEYQVRFDRPYVGLIANDRPKAVEAIVDALLPFNFRLANTQIFDNGTVADHKVVFRIPERGISFQFGAEEYRFGKDGSSWATADEDAEVLLAAENALLTCSGAKVGSCVLTLAMHLQPLVKTREEILAPFLPEPFKKLMIERKAQTYGNHLAWSDGDVLLDFSVAYSNGIFLRLTSQFKGHISLTDVLSKVRRDEEVVFGILGVEEATSA